ncbi:hypothetical protein HALA3H3_250008 [Halomonas sp. A3H3]|nr:hypothetical protein HALA3H3_250008 [Halomonas sp. A3H3]
MFSCTTLINLSLLDIFQWVASFAFKVFLYNATCNRKGEVEIRNPPLWFLLIILLSNHHLP